MLVKFNSANDCVVSSSPTGFLLKPGARSSLEVTYHQDCPILKVAWDVSGGGGYKQPFSGTLTYYLNNPRPEAATSGGVTIDYADQMHLKGAFFHITCGSKKQVSCYRPTSILYVLITGPGASIVLLPDATVRGSELFGGTSGSRGGH
jgi:hypothetical protein